MTLFDILVPLGAITVAVAGVLIVRMTDRPRKGHHPAE